MTAQEIEDFLAEKHLARIATIGSNSAPHVTPVWYLWEAKHLSMIIPKGSVKQRNIKRNNKVAITIDSHTTPNKGVIIEGTAKIEEYDEEINRKICERYLDEKDLEKYIEYSKMNFKSALLRITVRKIISWDNSKDPFIGKLAFKE